MMTPSSNQNRSNQHPSHEILTVWVFDGEIDEGLQAEWDPDSLREHFLSCPQCQQIVEELKQTSQFLDLSSVPEPSKEIDVAEILAESNREAGTTSMPVMVSQGNASWLSKNSLFFLAASLLVFGFVSFFLGMQYQSRLTQTAVNQQIEESFRKFQASLESRTPASNVVWRKKDFQVWLDKRIAELRSTDQSKSDLLVRKKLNEISGQIHSLLINQDSMKSDIVTLAVNADKEIKIAKNDIQQIKQYVNQFLATKP